VIEVVVLDVDDTLYLERDYVRSGFGPSAATRRKTTTWRAWGTWHGQSSRPGGGATSSTACFAASGSPSTRRSSAPSSRCTGSTSPRSPCSRTRSSSSTGCARRPSGWQSSPTVRSRASGRRSSARLVQDLAALVVLTAELGPGAGKPSLRAFELVERELGCTATQLVYLADNPARTSLPLPPGGGGPSGFAGREGCTSAHLAGTTSERRGGLARRGGRVSAREAR
jgi:putative hydrolase of the HAD superfamily